MADYFPIIEIPPDAPGEEEQMGTKDLISLHNIIQMQLCCG